MLKDKVIVITGASQGLGRELALQLAAQDAHLALVARNEKLLKELQHNIIAAGGIAEYFVCDVTKLVQIKKTVAAITQKFATIDVLINNAGIWTDQELETKQPTRRLHALETNTLGAINFCETVLPILQQKNQGTILNVISSAGVADIPAGNNIHWRTYGASKWGLVGYSHALRLAVQATKIKVIQFFPGGFESNLYENAQRPEAHHQPWMMKTKDVADAAIFALTRPDDVYVEQLVISKMV